MNSEIPRGDHSTGTSVEYALGRPRARCARAAAKAIQVMDREGDSVAVLNELSGAGARFVIRCNHNPDLREGGRVRGGGCCSMRSGAAREC